MNSTNMVAQGTAEVAKILTQGMAEGLAPSHAEGDTHQWSITVCFMSSPCLHQCPELGEAEFQGLTK